VGKTRKFIDYTPKPNRTPRHEPQSIFTSAHDILSINPVNRAQHIKIKIKLASYCAGASRQSTFFNFEYVDFVGLEVNRELLDDVLNGKDTIVFSADEYALWCSVTEMVVIV
jgi:hypothetical protein